MSKYFDKIIAHRKPETVKRVSNYLDSLEYIQNMRYAFLLIIVVFFTNMMCNA